MTIETILPWQNTLWDALLQRATQERLPHALLFIGADGVGKKQFALAFAHYLLCQSSTAGKACGCCRACHLLNAGSHPDIKLVEPEESAQVIKIDQIREIVSFINETALLGGYRVIIIHPASAMNISAANALLKSLEEPTPKALLILICNQSQRLPATISSRCQKIIFPKPTREMALSWLKENVNSDALELCLNLTENAPLKVNELLANETLTLRNNLYQALLQLSQQQADPLQLAAEWHDKEIQAVLILMLSWLRDLLRFKLTAIEKNIINIDYQAALSKLTGKITAKNLLEYLDHVQQSYARILHSLNVNRQLLIEELFIRWRQLCS
jgi:DNA polymerase-3 subunit delta'